MNATVRSARTDSAGLVSDRCLEIQEWIVQAMSRTLEIPVHEIDANRPFDFYGIDSTAAVDLVGSLEDWLGQPLEPNIVYQHPTAAALAAFLAGSSTPARKQ